MFGRFSKPDFTAEKKKKRREQTKKLATFRREVRALDQNKCQNYQVNHDRHDRVTVHHILFGGDGVHHENWNGICLCWTCHEKVHGTGLKVQTGQQYMIFILQQHQFKHDFRWRKPLAILKNKEG